MSENVVEVTAEVIQEDDALAVRFQPATITADFAGMREKLEAMIEPYKGLTAEIAASMDVKEAKACRADLNRISKQLDDDRKAIKKVYEAPLKEFEAQIKELQELIKEPCRLIDGAIKDREEAEREARYMELAQVFADFVPEGIGELIGFDRILDPKWLNKSFGAKKAENALTDKVSSVLAEGESFQKIKGQLRFPEECEREFWATLSLSAVNNRDEQLAQEQARIDAMNAEVAEVQAYQHQELPQIVQEAEQQVAHVNDPGSQVVYAWGFVIEATSNQVSELIGFMKAKGVHGHFRRADRFSKREAFDLMCKAFDGVCNG